ncbi:S8 family serine peptidase [Amycolatopsis vastitatis]|uniref:Peptidase S8 n=1 Tax=Amycolatopsis vastitatis TaxID=1905142 RepID=A0A229TF30_9PSEU|nr:S8 family serine peptidase [Amycolatopsis vastitatis]OXM69329.1 peptidase S8 [Amycolatopsis vastitatis]
MTIRFTRRPVVRAEHVDLPDWPQSLLDKHGSRMLRPADAARVPGTPPTPPPLSTVYRSAVLLFPRSVLLDSVLLEKIDKEINVTGASLLADGKTLPSADLPEELAGLDDRYTAQFPIPVALVAYGENAEVVDAYFVLQQIRTAHRLGRLDGNPGLDLISLEHLLVGAEYGGVPTWGPRDVRDAGDGGPNASYRMFPVAYTGAPPARSATPQGGRRVVIAVPDTGLNQHPWFGLTQFQGTLPPNGFLREFKASETAISAQQQHLSGLTPTEVLTDAWESASSENTVTEDVDRATGHFTFIAGRIRQNAPDADVLAMRVLHRDNVCYEADLLLAMYLLVARIANAQSDQDVVDIVSISLGGYVESASLEASHLRTVLKALAELGVIVVAAAGNDSTTRPFYPAAFASEPVDANDPWIGPPVIAVGALNVDDTQAWFSNAGPNVTVEATGANVVSTFPTSVRGPVGPGRTTRSGDRRSADPDVYPNGFAIGSGTSYAAPEVAAGLARYLVNQKVPITDVRTKKMRARAEQAIKSFRKDHP